MGCGYALFLFPSSQAPGCSHPHPNCVYPRCQVLPPPLPGGCWESPVNVHSHELLSLAAWRLQASNSLFLSLLGCSPKYLHFLPPYPAVTCCCCTLHLGSPLVSEGLIPKHHKVLGNLHCSSGIRCGSSSICSFQALCSLGISITAPWQGCSIPGKFLPQCLVAVLSTGAFGSPISPGTRTFYPFPSAFREHGQSFSTDFLSAFN